VPRQTNSAHDIDFEKPLPIFVSYLAERLRFEYPEIIHQNVGFADALYESGDTCGGGEIDGNALDFDLRHLLCEPLYRGINVLLGAAIESTAAPVSARPRAMAIVPGLPPVRAEL
jgi:hypothetical protein